MLEFLLAALAAQGPAANVPANSVGPQSDRPITIVGQTPEEIEREADDYVRQLGVSWNRRQAARWYDPVCPRVAGLDPPIAAIAENQIRQIAQSVGVRLEKPGCRANLAIIFTNDARALLKRIDARRLREVPFEDRDSLRMGDHPIRWWYTTKVLIRDGTPVTGVQPIVRIDGDTRGPTASGGVLPGASDTVYGTPSGTSNLSTQDMRAIESATVVIQVQGQNLDAASAAAALVGLAELQQGAAPERSILTSVRKGGPLRDLTANDRAFLESLYKIHMARRGEQQRRALIDGIIKSRLPKPPGGSDR